MSLTTKASGKSLGLYDSCTLSGLSEAKLSQKEVISQHFKGVLTNSKNHSAKADTSEYNRYSRCEIVHSDIDNDLSFHLGKSKSVDDWVLGLLEKFESNRYKDDESKEIINKISGLLEDE